MVEENPNEGQCSHIDCASGECLVLKDACIYMEDQERCIDFEKC